MLLAAGGRVGCREQNSIFAREVHAEDLNHVVVIERLEMSFSFSVPCRVRVVVVRTTPHCTSGAFL